MGIKGHALSLRPLQPDQSHVMLPALCAILLVHLDALWRKHALKVVLLLRMVIAELYQVPRGVTSKTEMGKNMVLLFTILSIYSIYIINSHI